MTNDAISRTRSASDLVSEAFRIIDDMAGRLRDLAVTRPEYPVTINYTLGGREVTMSVAGEYLHRSLSETVELRRQAAVDVLKMAIQQLEEAETQPKQAGVSV